MKVKHFELVSKHLLFFRSRTKVEEQSTFKIQQQHVECAVFNTQTQHKLQHNAEHEIEISTY